MTTKTKEFPLPEPITLINGKDGMKQVDSLVFRYPNGGDTLAVPQPFRVIASPGNKSEVEMDRAAVSQWMIRLSTQGLSPEDFVALPGGFPFNFMGWLGTCLADVGNVGN